MPKDYTEVDYSGDIGIEARGRDLKELLENLTRGFFGLLCRSSVAAVVERRVEVDSASAEELIVDWLSEVLTEGNARGELYSEVAVQEVGQHYAKGVLRGEAVDPLKHDLRFDVKAATYHNISVTRESDGLRSRVIFDL